MQGHNAKGEKMTVLSRCSRVWPLVAALALLLGLAAPAVAGVDYQGYGQLLAKYVKNGLVDYGGLQKEANQLDRFLVSLAGVRVDSLPQAEQKALYINAYNAAALKLVLSRYPSLVAIKDLGWFLRPTGEIPVVTIGGKNLGLDYIYHTILRVGFGEPRVHFALAGATRGGPGLLGEPYTATRLEEQLNAQTRAFVNEPTRVHFEGKILKVSPIFKWWQEDFSPSVLGFIRLYAKGGLLTELVSHKMKVEIEYTGFDWSLNSQ